MNDQQKIEQLEHTAQQLEGRIKILTLANSKQHEPCIEEEIDELASYFGTEDITIRYNHDIKEWDIRIYWYCKDGYTEFSNQCEAPTLEEVLEKAKGLVRTTTLCMYVLSIP